MHVREMGVIVDRLRYCQRELARARRLAGPTSPLPVGCRVAFRWLAHSLRREERALRWVLGEVITAPPYPGEGWAQKPGRRPPKGMQATPLSDRLQNGLES